MTKPFEIKDMSSGIEVVHYEDSDYIEFNTYRGGRLISIIVSAEDLMKIFLVSVEAGLIDRKEAIIELQTE